MDYSFQQFLLSGERLLWTGRPPGGVHLRMADWFLIPFSVVWLAFVTFWNVAVWTGNGPVFFKLFGALFLAVGAYFLLGRFLLDARSRAQTGYAVTDRRILISQGGGSNVRSLDIRSLPSLQMDEDKDGSGSIRFGAVASLQNMVTALWLPDRDATPSFVRIPEVRRVYSLIQKQAFEGRG
jgi:hypothetical protein